jgi:hypothetical protein
MASNFDGNFAVRDAEGKGVVRGEMVHVGLDICRDGLLDAYTSRVACSGGKAEIAYNLWRPHGFAMQHASSCLGMG